MTRRMFLAMCMYKLDLNTHLQHWSLHNTIIACEKFGGTSFLAPLILTCVAHRCSLFFEYALFCIIASYNLPLRSFSFHCILLNMMTCYSLVCIASNILAVFRSLCFDVLLFRFVVSVIWFNSCASSELVPHMVLLIIRVAATSYVSPLRLLLMSWWSPLLSFIVVSVVFLNCLIASYRFSLFRITPDASLCFSLPFYYFLPLWTYHRVSVVFVVVS